MNSDTPPPYSAVLFDCDSTLSGIEGIDELAADHADEIAALTNAAMSGKVPLESVYGKRLDLIQPTRQAVDAIGALYVERCLPNVKELVAALHELGKRVYIVSGGVRAAVLVLAQHLNIDAERVYAVDLKHDAGGDYCGFDEVSPLARDGGKPLILQTIGEPEAALIGDGTSDLEAASEVQRFIAFGGVVARPAVMDSAAVSCSEPDFAALLPLLCNADELATLSESPIHSAIVRAASLH